MLLAPFVQVVWCKYESTCCSLQTCTSDCSLHSATDPITGTFPMRCGKEMPFCSNAEVQLMLHQVTKVLVVFILTSSTITKVVQFGHRRQDDFDLFNNILLKCVNSNCVMMHTVADNADAQALQDVILLVVDNKGM